MAFRSHKESGRGLGFEQISDGLAKTVVAWEAMEGGFLYGSGNVYPWFCNIGTQGICNRTTNPLQMRVLGKNTSGGPNPSSDHGNELSNILMADGSTSTIDKTISPTVWGNMCVRNDGK